MSSSEPVGTIATLWRFPVKSMLGEELDAVHLSEGGIVGDRAYALRDGETGKVASAKHPKLWPNLFATGKIVIPEHVVDGLNLIWHSDLVISGGGTMNREAAALGVPVYSIFRGRIGAVDRYLAAQGRLILLESAEDLAAKVRLVQRERPARPDGGNLSALQKIIDNVVSILDPQPHTTCRKAQ